MQYTHLQWRLQIILIALRKILDCPRLLRGLHCGARLLQMPHILRVRCLPTPRMVPIADAGKDNGGSVLMPAAQREKKPGQQVNIVRAPRATRQERKALAIMLSRMNCCVGFGSTGYPLTLAIKVDDGRKMYRTDSAAHLLSTPRVVGSAGERSSA